MFDTSSIVYAWDNYPIVQFPILWGWLGDEIGDGHLTMPQKGFEELEKVNSDCARWAREKNIRRISIDAAILQEAFRIKGLLNIIDEQYGAGVGEIDLLIIATAREKNAELISNEKVQMPLPTTLLMKNYKIPAVCDMAGVGVSCVNFLDFLKQSGKVFG